MTTAIPRPSRTRCPDRIPMFVLLAALGLIAVSGFLWAVDAQPQPDPMQRFFLFHNELPIPIYPVISAGANANCPGKYGSAGTLRILINGTDGRGKGIKKGETVVVKLPKTEDPGGANPSCPNGLLYNAARINIFTVSPEAFDVELQKYPTSDNPVVKKQGTTELFEPWTRGLCQTLDGTPVAGCWGGAHQPSTIRTRPAS
jgi:hypothetical protein